MHLFHVPFIFFVEVDTYDTKLDQFSYDIHTKRNLGPINNSRINSSLVTPLPGQMASLGV
jgi:hypothetical protein